MKSYLDAKKLGEQLLIEHGLDDWRIVFIDAQSKFGHCCYVKKEIALSRDHVRNHRKNYIRGTILHEIAHALVGPKVKAHGPEWQAQAQCLGLKGDLWETAKALRASRRRKLNKRRITK